MDEDNGARSFSRYRAGTLWTCMHGTSEAREKHKCYPPADIDAECILRALRRGLEALRGVFCTVATADTGRILPRGHAETSPEACVMCLLYRYCRWTCRLSRSLPLDGGKTGCTSHRHVLTILFLGITSGPGSHCGSLEAGLFLIPSAISLAFRYRVKNPSVFRRGRCMLLCTYWSCKDLPLSAENRRSKGMLGDAVSPALGESVEANIRPGVPGKDIGVPTGLRIMFASR